SRSFQKLPFARRLRRSCEKAAQTLHLLEKTLHPSDDSPSDTDVNAAALSVIPFEPLGDLAPELRRVQTLAVGEAMLLCPAAIVVVQLAGADLPIRFQLARFIEERSQRVALDLVSGRRGGDRARRDQAAVSLPFNGAAHGPREDAGRLVPERRAERLVDAER